MDDMIIEHEIRANGGQYYTVLDGKIAKLTYQDKGNGIRIADHTFVPDALRGQGIAGKLVAKLVADARETPFKIIPQCSYVEAAFRRHPEWREMLATGKQ